jgi:F-type H+-transporting ATPase subunit a
VLHCAEVGLSGYPAIQAAEGRYQYWIDQSLDAGTAGTEENLHACEEFKKSGVKPAKEDLAHAADEVRAAEESIAANEALSEGEREVAIAAARLEIYDHLYHGATVPLTAEEIEMGVIPYTFTVTPYVRGATTDLNLTLALAFISVVAIQVFGTIAQGANYWQKYINLNALGNIKKRPLGVVDFIVGLFEIISELGKLISLSFRLFGNMFAGGILLAVMAFLIALILPSIFLGLEVIVTTIQALVFAILTLVFSAQAMEGHHGDDDEHHEDGDEHLEEHDRHSMHEASIAPTAPDSAPSA